MVSLSVFASIPPSLRKQGPSSDQIEFAWMGSVAFLFLELFQDRLNLETKSPTSHPPLPSQHKTI